MNFDKGHELTLLAIVGQVARTSYLTRENIATVIPFDFQKCFLPAKEESIFVVNNTVVGQFDCKSICAGCCLSFITNTNICFRSQSALEILRGHIQKFPD
jgi:hypothetical protein